MPHLDRVLVFGAMKVVAVLRFLVFGCLPAVCLSVAGQNARGSVSGTVICDDTNAPARGAHVSLIPLDHFLPKAPTSGADGISPSTRTDFNGAYEIGSVHPGIYLVSAGMNGYLNDVRLALSKLDRLKGSDKEKVIAELGEVTVKPGADARKDIVLRHLAAISGRVTVDAGGLPGPAQVIATRMRDEESEGAQSTADEIMTVSAVLDDRGAYRIAGLPEGKYRLSVQISESHMGYKMPNGGGIQMVPVGPGTAHLTIYAPEALDKSNARVFEVKDGDEITDADINIPTRLLHSIGGIVMEDGVPRAGVEVSFQRLKGPIEPHTAISLPDGSFRFDLLPAGTYTLRAGSGEVTIQLQDTDIADAIIDLHSRAGHARE